MSKSCSRCFISKPFIEFYKQKKGADGYCSHCKACQKSLMAEWYLKNKKSHSDSRRRYYLKNKEEINKKSSAWYSQNKEKVFRYSKLYKRHKRASNLEFRLIENARRRIRQAIKNKSQKTVKLLGCTPSEYKLYLESKFLEGMSWDNYGKWHIDHIKPISSFNLSKPEEQLKCFHYSNTQPLWALDNLKKSKKITVL